MEVSWDFHKHNDMLGFSLLWDNSKPVSHTYRIHTPQGLLSISFIPPGTYAYKTLCPANLNPPRLPWSLPLPNNISVKNDSRDLPVHCTEKQPKFLPYPSISPSFKQLLKKKPKKLISLIPSFYPTPPQLPSVPCCFLPATTFIVFMTPIPSLQGITPARQRLAWMSFSLLKQPPGILVNKLSISFHKEAHHKKVLHPWLSTT